MYIVLLVMLLFVSPGCVSTDTAPQGQGAEGAAPVVKPEDVPEATLPKSDQPVPGEDPCIPFNDGFSKPPFYLTAGKIVVTRILRSCVTRQGRRGFEKDSPWMAMGFPCTAGNGKVEIRGNYYAPNIISFILSNSCERDPADPGFVEGMGRKALGLSEGSKLVAYNPFAVQYWEMESYRDSDTGHVVDLRSAEGRAAGWKQFKAGEEIKVRLYGQENSWVRGKHLYQVDAGIVKTDRTSFRLDVHKIRALDQEELSAAMARCERTGDRRVCAEIFTL